MASIDRRAFGSWPSSIRPEDMPAGSLRLGLARFVGPTTTGGRSPCRLRRAARRFFVPAADPVLPAPWSARSRVHEYGGGAWTLLDDERFAFVEAVGPARVISSRGLRSVPADAGRIRASPHGDLVWAEDALWAVRETHDRAARRRRYARSFGSRLTGPGAEDPGGRRSVVSGSDFVAYPTPRAGRIAWIAWDHPDMPWDAAELRVGTLDEDGTVSDWVVVAGGTERRAGRTCRPCSPSGRATTSCCSRRTPRPHPGPTPGAAPMEPVPIRFDDDLTHAPAAPVYVVDGDTGGPLWSLGSRWYAALDDGNVVAVVTDGPFTTDARRTGLGQRHGAGDAADRRHPGPRRARQTGAADGRGSDRAGRTVGAGCVGATPSRRCAAARSI